MVGGVEDERDAGGDSGIWRNASGGAGVRGMFSD